MILEDCVNIPDDLETISPNYFVNGSAQYLHDHYYLNSAKKYYLTTNFVDITPTLDNELTSKFYVDTEINTKQDTITDGTLTIARTDGLQTALNGKQATITTSTDVTCNKITTSSTVLVSNIIAGFELVKPTTFAVRLNNTFDGYNLLAYNTNTDITGFNGFSVIELIN